MPIRTNEFQQLVNSVHRLLASPATVTQSKYLPDRATGAKREVDVVVETPLEHGQWTTSIECRDRSRLADVSWVEEMIGKHNDLPTNELILVSRQGFTPQARRKALFHRVQTLSLDEAVTADWTEVVGKLSRVYVPLLRSRPLQCEAIFVKCYATSQLPPITLDTVLCGSDGHPWGTLAQIGEAIAHEASVGRSIMVGKQGVPGEYSATVTYRVPAGSYMEDSEHIHHEIAELRYHIGFQISERYPVQLQSGSLGDVPVAFGTLTESGSKYRLTVVEPAGRPLVVDLQGD